MKIETLTKFQEQELIEFRAEWLAKGRSTAPADRPKAERAITRMYELMGAAPPKFWWCDGPAVGSLARAFLTDKKILDFEKNDLGANIGDRLRDRLRANLRANIGDRLRANLGDNLAANIAANLRANLAANLRANIGDRLRANLRANIAANIAANLRANIGDNLGDNLRDNLGDNLYWPFWGRHEASWPAYYMFPHIKLRVMHTADQIENLQLWIDVSEACFWWQPYKGICFICEPPSVQSVDDQGLLHADKGPAILCRDGWSVYAVHGVRVPADVIEAPETITVERIEAEANAEVRRVMIERFNGGLAAYLTASCAQEIHRDDYGILYRKEIKDDEPLVMVKVVNSTVEPDGHFKDYFLRCPPDIKTAKGAVAWSFGRTEEDYAPAIET